MVTMNFGERERTTKEGTRNSAQAAKSHRTQFCRLKIAMIRMVVTNTIKAQTTATKGSDKRKYLSLFARDRTAPISQMALGTARSSAAAITDFGALLIIEVMVGWRGLTPELSRAAKRRRLGRIVSLLAAILSPHLGELAGRQWLAKLHNSIQFAADTSLYGLGRFIDLGG